MFSLIISIIAIALVAALALASIYYGGSAFQEGASDAEASTVINQGQQVQAAVTMADVDEAFEAGTTTLDDIVTDNYLKEVPSVRSSNWVLNAAGDFLQVEVINEEVCMKIEEQFDGDETVGDIADEQAFGCEADTTDIDGDGNGPDGEALSTSHVAYYKI